MIRKILFLASNPIDTGRLRLDKEFRAVDEGLKRSNERANFDLTAKFAVRGDDLRRGLLDESPEFVHFAGHGDGVNGILLENDMGVAAEIPNEALAELLALCAGNIKCVLINACHSDAQAKAIAKHIPYAIGMSDSISDDAALEFAVGFYDALGAGRGIEEAFKFGCNAIALKGGGENQIPVLKRRAPTEEERSRLSHSGNLAPDIQIDTFSSADASCGEPRRDVWLYDAIWRAFTGVWARPVMDLSGPGIGPSESQRLYDLIVDLRQKAFEGDIPVWAKRAGSNLWETVPRETWRAYSFVTAQVR